MATRIHSGPVGVVYTDGVPTDIAVQSSGTTKGLGVVTSTPAVSGVINLITSAGSIIPASLGGLNMSLVQEWSVNNTTGNAGQPYYLVVPAGKAGGLIWVDGAAAGGGGGGGANGSNWAAGGGGGSSGMSCLMLPIRIPPTTTRLAIIIGKGGAGGATGASAGTNGTAGSDGTATQIYDPDLTFSGDSTANIILNLWPGSGGGGGNATTGTAGAGGAVGAPSYQVGAGTAGAAATRPGGNGSIPTNVRVLDGLFLQCGGGGGGGTDLGTAAGVGGDGVNGLYFCASAPGGNVGGTSNWKAGGGGGGQSCLAGRWPGYQGAGGVGGVALPYHTPTIPGNGGGGGSGNGGGAAGADGCIRIYW